MIADGRGLAGRVNIPIPANFTPVRRCESHVVTVEFLPVKGACGFVGIRLTYDVMG